MWIPKACGDEAVSHQLLCLLSKFYVSPKWKKRLVDPALATEKKISQQHWGVKPCTLESISPQLVITLIKFMKLRKLSFHNTSGNLFFNMQSLLESTRINNNELQLCRSGLVLQWCVYNCTHAKGNWGIFCLTHPANQWLKPGTRWEPWSPTTLTNWPHWGTYFD